jgi:hypothetical protein
LVDDSIDSCERTNQFKEFLEQLIAYHFVCKHGAAGFACGGP